MTLDGTRLSKHRPALESAVAMRIDRHFRSYPVRFQAGWPFGLIAGAAMRCFQSLLWLARKPKSSRRCFLVGFPSVVTPRLPALR
ncbi:hypothetical protein ALP38_200006 [Pseudomonas amygdali pv. sesami]|nr:hypothetical protein ALP38_200006 [Pseudomonas amygdali pv. sesami]